MTQAEHRRLVEERRKSSRLWQIIHLLGSLHLAVILLAVISIACAVATFIESGFSSKIAHAYIYSAPWFIAWLALLIVNLMAVTLTRWPWLPKHRGFVITHYGIIILLIGAKIGTTAGFEGGVTLDKGIAADHLISKQTILSIQTLQKSELIPFDPEAKRPSERRPRTFRIKETPLSLIVDRYSPQLLRSESVDPSPDPSAPPGVFLSFRSARMNSSIEMPLLAAPGKDKGDLAGLAMVKIVEGFPETPTVEDKGTPWNEMHVTLAAAPGAPVTKTIGGEPSGIIPTLEVSGDSILLHLDFPDGNRLSYRLSEILGKAFDARWAKVEMLEYWPDFEMRDGRPTTRSKDPNNPAVLLRLSGASKPSSPALAEQSPMLLLNTEGITSGKIAYRLTRNGVTSSQGELKVGEPLATGWADWVVVIEKAAPHARLRAEWREADSLSNFSQQTVPGIRARLIASGPGEIRTEGEPVWIGLGSNVILSAGNNVIRAGFGYRLIPLDFKVTLEQFDVPRLPGSDRPANFISTVRFEDALRGVNQVATIRMNHPASFPPGVWGQISGRTLKFSQASWNPQNLDETTLQVLYDPGWLLKWVGSVMICVGIAIMFYFKPSGVAHPSRAENAGTSKKLDPDVTQIIVQPSRNLSYPKKSLPLG